MATTIKESKIGKRLIETLKRHRENGFKIELLSSPKVNGKERVKIVVSNNGNEIRTVDRLDACDKAVAAAVEVLN